MSITGFLNSVGTMPEENDMKIKKKIIKLLNGKTRIVYNVPEDQVKNVCRYCGELFTVCLCDRTEHVYDAKIGGCVLCGEKFKPNGTGPSNNRFLHSAINLFWFNRWVSNISDKHDIGYFEGFTDIRKTIEDYGMRERTYDKIDSKWWLRPKFAWKKRADLNWIAVDKCGDSSFNWSGCVVESLKNNDIKKIA